jgi:hypothetical protein
MKKSLPCFTALAAFILAGTAIAQSPATPPVNLPPALENLPPAVQADETTAGDQLLTKAANELGRHASISARLFYAASIDGKDIKGVGNYWQQGSGDELKVRLELRIEGHDAQLLQVCNGRFMWIDRKLPTGRVVSRIELRKLRADPTLNSDNLSEIKSGEASWSPLQSVLTPYMGGLPALLGSLSENFTFMPPQSSTLEIAPPDAAPTKLPVYAVVGHWKSDKIAALLAKAPSLGIDGQPLPATPPKQPHKGVPKRLPEEVLVVFRQADLFPYHIEYRKVETPALPAGGPAAPYQLSVHPMVVVEFTDVVFNAEMPAGQFDYVSGDANLVDQTPIILERLREKHRAEVATRPADLAPPSR